MATCWYNNNLEDIKENLKEDGRNYSNKEILPIGSCKCGMHSWSGQKEKHLKALQCMQHQFINRINSLRLKQWEDKICSPSNLQRSYDLNERCKSVGEMLYENYPEVLSPYSLCWWQEADPVVPPLHTGLRSRYGYEYRMPQCKCCPTEMKIAVNVQSVRSPTLERAVRSEYVDCPLTTVYQDSISYTGYTILRDAKNYAEPLPSSRRNKDRSNPCL